LTNLIKYPQQTKESNKVFFEKKDKELTDLDWAKWGGWWDTDGSFPSLRREAILRLKDRQPVELFSKTFETSLTKSITKTITPEPYRYKYIITMYNAALRGKKAVWFAKKVYPYLIKQEKKDYAVKLLGYRPESKDFADWTPQEVRNYLATALEGDGNFALFLGKKVRGIRARISSSDVQYLSNIKYLAETRLGLIFNLSEVATYKTQEGIKTKYILYMDSSSRKQNNIDFFKSLVKDNVMTLDRKKQKVQEFLGGMPR
jgi:hypothetical protein